MTQPYLCLLGQHRTCRSSRMRLSAGWRATPGFTIRCFRLFILPISGRAGSAGARRRQTPGVSGARPACTGAAGHAPTIRLAARPDLGRLSRQPDIGGFDFPPPRRGNCARPGLSGQMGTARDSYLDGGALRPGPVTSPALWLPPGGPSRSSLLARDRADLAVGATSARGGECTSALCARRSKPGAGRPPGPAIRPSPGERAQVSWWFVCGRDAESHR
jgi:hypothetical protein